MNFVNYFLILILISFISLQRTFAYDYSFITPNSDQACQLIPNDLAVLTSTPSVSPAVLPAPKSKMKFFELIEYVQKKYKSIFKKHDLQVRYEINWESPINNAFALPDGPGGKRKLILHGELFRNQFITSDAYLFVLCHEVGHLMGGSPFNAFYPQLSAEGQADYYSTNICLPFIFAEQDNSALIKKLNVPLSVKIKCDRIWKNENDSALCQRSIMAAYSFAKFIALDPRGEKISLTKHDHEKASETFDNRYPEPQCRFDTALAGSLCAKKLNSTQEVGESANCSLHHHIQSGAARPECWFKSPDFSFSSNNEEPE